MVVALVLPVAGFASHLRLRLSVGVASNADVG